MYIDRRSLAGGHLLDSIHGAGVLSVQGSMDLVGSRALQFS
jgi:hypothetical protein